MSRTTRTLVVLLLSVVVAGIASFLVFQQVQNVPVREVEVRSYQVAVAARALPMGTLLTASDIKLVAWPQSSQVAGAYGSVDEVVNRGLLAAVAENEPLTAAKVATREAGAGLPPMITEGMRAISVKVDEVIGVAGFVVPGARVDVVVTLNQQQDGVARTVVENAQVLTAGTRIDQDQARDGRPLPSTVVTLLVSPDNAERIALASAVGRITLTLRNPMDRIPLTTNGTRVTALMGAPQAPPPAAAVIPVRRARLDTPAPPPTPPALPPPYMVETIRAAKRGAEEVK
jgi:pilus assembly protein CpaB